MNNNSFFDWMDSVANSPMGRFGASKGFSIYYTGGGCHHFYKENKTHYVLICEESGIPDKDNMNWQVGLYAHDGDGVETAFYENISKGLREVLEFADFVLQYSDILWTNPEAK